MSGAEIREDKAGALLKVRVSPGARADRILGLHGNALKLSVRSAPERGRANTEAARVLAEALGARPGDVCVARGGTSREKWILFSGWDREKLDAAVQALLVTLGER